MRRYQNLVAAILAGLAIVASVLLGPAPPKPDAPRRIIFISTSETVSIVDDGRSPVSPCYR